MRLRLLELNIVLLEKSYLKMLTHSTKHTLINITSQRIAPYFITQSLKYYKTLIEL